jgi:hypothetical protein
MILFDTVKGVASRDNYKYSRLTGNFFCTSVLERDRIRSKIKQKYYGYGTRLEKNYPAKQDPQNGVGV